VLTILANQDPYMRRYSVVSMTIARCEQRKRQCSNFVRNLRNY